MRNPNLERERSFFSGTQRFYFFPNGYGASVVQGEGTYGYEKGLWELAVITWKEDAAGEVDGKAFDLCYDTPITDNVLGYLSEDAVDELLVKIESLPALALEESK